MILIFTLRHAAQIFFRARKILWCLEHVGEEIPAISKFDVVRYEACHILHAVSPGNRWEDYIWTERFETQNIESPLNISNLSSLCRMWVMSPLWDEKALPGSPGGVREVGGGGGVGATDQACWNHKWLGRRREKKRQGEGSFKAAAKRQFSLVSLIKLVDTWKDMEGRQREREGGQRGGDEGQWGSCRAQCVDITGLIDAEPPGEGDFNIDSGISFPLLTLTFRDSNAFSSLILLSLTSIRSQNNISQKCCSKQRDCRDPNAAFHTRDFFISVECKITLQLTNDFIVK